MSILALNKVNELKSKILTSEELIQNEQKSIKQLKEQLSTHLNNTYPLISLEGQPYFHHKTKWGAFDEEDSFSRLNSKAISAFSYFKVQDIISGEVLNQQDPIALFNNDSLYLQYVIYEWDVYDEHNQETDSIWEYLWIELPTEVEPA